jgi:hypothetical protein
MSFLDVHIQMLELEKLLLKISQTYVDGGLEIAQRSVVDGEPRRGRPRGRRRSLASMQNLPFARFSKHEDLLVDMWRLLPPFSGIAARMWRGERRRHLMPNGR